MTEIEAIKERHSVRNYISKNIEAEKVKLLQDKITELNLAGNLHFQFIDEAGKTYNRLANKAMGLGSVLWCRLRLAMERISGNRINPRVLIR